MGHSPDRLEEILLERGVEALKEVVSKTAGPVFGPAAEELGQYFADKVRFRRSKNFLRFLSEYLELKQSLHLEQVEPPLRLLHPILEYASLEDDDYLRKTWAHMLHNAASLNPLARPDPSFPQVLAQLTAQEVKILDQLFDSDDRILNVLRLETKFQVKYVGQIMIHKLSGLGMLRPTAKNTRMFVGDFQQDFFVAMNNDYELTAFGASFVAACKPANKVSHELPPPVTNIKVSVQPTSSKGKV